MKKLTITLLIAALWTQLSTVVHAETLSEFAEIAKTGKAERSLGQYDQATETFIDGYKQARLADDLEWQQRFLFYRANNYLDQAENADKSLQFGLSLRAIDSYHHLIEQRSDSGTAKVNLARAYALSGNPQRAKEWFEAAINQNDKKQTLYRLEYVKFLTPSNPRAAVSQLEIALRDQPKNRSAQQQLVRLYKDNGYTFQLQDYLNELITNGQALRAEQLTFDIMLDTSTNPRDRIELMPVLAQSLARQYFSAREYLRSDFARKLKEIVELQPDLALCAKEISRTIGSGQAIEYNWWDRSLEHAKAITTLMRARAKYWDGIGRLSSAESWYAAAANLIGKENPQAIRDLINFYSKRGNIAGVNQVAKEYQYQLFQGKGQAYSRGDSKAIYEYHRTLASIYAFQAQKTGNWGSMQQSNTAAFQLEHAFRTAKRTPDIEADPRLISDLAKSYDATNKAAAANRLRLSAAEDFKAKGNVRAANTVLKDVKRETLSQPQRVRFERMQSNQVILEPGNNAQPGPAAITPGNNVIQPAQNVVVPNNNVNLQNRQNVLPADNE